jgi:hypothetical protein
MKKIWLSGKRGEGKYTIVDDEDFTYLSNLKIYLDSVGRASIGIYSKLHKKQNHVRIHKIIMWCPDGYFIDHINGNPLDNRRCNLRIVTPQQNCWHKTQNRKDNTSGYKGVTRHHEKWRAQIYKGGRQIRIGRFTNKIDAAKAYNDKAIDLFGEYAYLNVI